MATGIDVKKIKNISAKMVQIVYGYVRRQRENIPQPIIDFILLFYCEYDEWDVVTSSVVKDGKCIQLQGKSMIAGNAYLKNTISDGVFSWRFKIVSVCDEMNIGVVKASNINTSWGRFFQVANTAYVWEAVHYKNKGCLMNPTKGGHVMLRDYGPACKDGDIVEMVLDLEQMTMRYKVNDIDLGIAFEEIEKTEYKGAIFMYTYNDKRIGCIELLD